MRPEALGEGDHLVGGGHFEVERLRQFARQPRHVGVADMAPVLAQVSGDAVGAGGDGEKRGADRVGQGTAAGIPHRRDMVDVHTQAQPLGHHPFPSSFRAVHRRNRASGSMQRM